MRIRFTNIPVIKPDRDDEVRIRYKNIPVITGVKRVKPLESYNYLSGALGLDYLKGIIEGVERKIYILHDAHTITGECPSKLQSVIRTNEWVKQILEESPKFIDVFLESHYAEDYATVKKVFPKKGFRVPRFIFEIFQSTEEDEGVEKEEKIPDTLNLLADDLTPCYRPDRSECPYDNVRIHYTDLRNYSQFVGMFYGPIPLPDLFDFILSSFSRHTNDSDLLSKENFLNYIIENSKGTKIEKQWQQGPFADVWKDMVRTMVGVYFDRRVKGAAFTLLALIELIQSVPFDVTDDEIIFWIEDKEPQSFVYTRDEFKMFLVYMYTPFMDLYLMGRMLKKFKVSEGLEEDPLYAENIIVYAGGVHAETYYDFLTEVLGFKSEYRAKEYPDYAQCLKIDDIQYPLFS